MRVGFQSIIRIVAFLFVTVLVIKAQGFDLPLDSTPMDRDDPKYLTSYAPVIKPAKEAVVSVHTSRILKVIRSGGMDPREELMRRYLGLPLPRQQAPTIEERRVPQGVGSGVVISAEGYILTNNHVISTEDGEAADEILVELNDGRELSAQLVGRDPRSDLAVLKVDAENLPYLPIADSEQLEVGDVVFAIGNPMGVGLTITQGIVSATGRSNLSILGDSGYESFIQTDAPINPGNSGGALIDAYGRLVGINTAILSRSGGSIGLGFAIPSAFARKVALALVGDGEVRRGVLGVNIEDIDADYAEAFELPDTQGALVQSVIQDLPADIAGLRNGDVITAIDGHVVVDATALRMKVGEYPPGATIQVDYFRDGRAMECAVVLSSPDDPYDLESGVGEIVEGVEGAIINDAWRKQFGLSRKLEGLLVLSVMGNSPYVDVLQPGCVLLEIDGVTPSTVIEARDLINTRKVTRLYVYFKGRRGYLSIRGD